MTKPIILVKICYKLLYVIQGVENNFGKATSWPLADIRVFGRTCLLAMLLLIGLALFTPQVFLFNIPLTRCESPNGDDSLLWLLLISHEKLACT